MFEEQEVPLLEIIVVSSGLIEEEVLWEERQEDIEWEVNDRRRSTWAGNHPGRQYRH